jgi:hypothetical protein
MPITAPTKIKITPETLKSGKTKVITFSPKSRSGSQPEKDSGNGNNNNNNINGGGGGNDDEGKRDRCQNRYNNEFANSTVKCATGWESSKDVFSCDQHGENDAKAPKDPLHSLDP